MNQKDILKNQIELIGKRLSVEGDKLLIEPLIIDYDNGGGQSGIRENPFIRHTRNYSEATRKRSQHRRISSEKTTRTI